MDPLSVASGVAGVAMAGVAISSALFDLVASVRDAPKEMLEMGQSIHDLATVLRELRRVLRRARKMLRSRLLRAVGSVLDRIRDTHDRVDRLLDVEAGLVRIFWAFRRARATKLLATLESHKSTVQLMATTITLALVQRQDAGYDFRWCRRPARPRRADRDAAPSRELPTRDPFFGGRRKRWSG